MVEEALRGGWAKSGKEKKKDIFLVCWADKEKEKKRHGVRRGEKETQLAEDAGGKGIT